MSEFKIAVRPAIPEDAEAIYRFVCELEEIAFDFHEIRNCFLQNISNNNNIYLVATDENGLVLGYLSCHGQTILHHCGKVFEIQEMFVRSDQRSKGIGSMMIVELESILSGIEHELLEVTSKVKRIAAHRFYERHGFRHTHFKFVKSSEDKNEE